MGWSRGKKIAAGGAAAAALLVGVVAASGGATEAEPPAVVQTETPEPATTETYDVPTGPELVPGEPEGEPHVPGVNDYGNDFEEQEAWDGGGQNEPSEPYEPHVVPDWVHPGPQNYDHPEYIGPEIDVQSPREVQDTIDTYRSFESYTPDYVLD